MLSSVMSKVSFVQVLALVVTGPVCVVFASGMSSTASIDPGTWLRLMQR